jgi:signal transduction histidine kinase
MLSLMRSFAATRRPFPRAAAFLVPALGALFAASAIAGTFFLQRHEADDRARELALVDVRGEFNALQNMPWDSRSMTGAMPRAESLVYADLRRLHLDALRPRVQANVTLLYSVVAYVAAGDTEQASKIARRTRTSAAPVIAALDEAARSATHDANRADLESSVGSAVAILLLLAGFLVFHIRLRRAHGDERTQRIALLARTVEGADEERRRIAGDLHDGPIQRLTASAFALDLVVNRLARGELTTVAEDLGEVREALAEQMRELRRLMTELRPPVLDEGGVAAAIANRAVLALGEDSICSVHDRTGAVRFLPELETAVYRVAGEALANVARHARASRVDVIVERRGDALHLAVADDGVGFDANAQRYRDHLGLKSMEERTESVGGVFRVVSAPGLGTRIEATIPWRARVVVEEDRLAVA